MKLAEAIALIGELRDEANLIKQADIQLYRKEGEDTVLDFSKGFMKYVEQTAKIAWYKAEVARANANVVVEFDGAKLPLNELRLLIDGMRETLAMVKGYYTTARTQPVREEYDYNGAMGERVKIVKTLNGVTAEGLKAVMDEYKSKLKQAEATLARANWDTEIPVYPD